jgi:hypothetical protein
MLTRRGNLCPLGGRYSLAQITGLPLLLEAGLRLGGLGWETLADDSPQPLTANDPEVSEAMSDDSPVGSDRDSHSGGSNAPPLTDGCTSLSSGGGGSSLPFVPPTSSPPASVRARVEGKSKTRNPPQATPHGGQGLDPLATAHSPTSPLHANGVRAHSAKDHCRFATERDTATFTQCDYYDPQLSPADKSRQYAVGFRFDEAQLAGGQDFIRAQIPKSGCNSLTFVDRRGCRGMKYVRAVFVDPIHFSNFFKWSLRQFRQAFCETGLGDPTAMPRPSIWKEGVRHGGLFPTEWPGLVVWRLPMRPRDALAEVIKRVLMKLSCTIRDLPLYLDPDAWVKLNNGNLQSTTTVKLYTYSATTALQLADGDHSAASSSQLRSLNPCGICKLAPIFPTSAPPPSFDCVSNGT